MSVSQQFIVGEHELEAIIATDQIVQREVRQPDYAKETRYLIELQRQLSEDPATFFPKLANAALGLTNADSTGISLLNAHEKRFVWPAVSRPLSPYLWQGTPQVFGPCGTVLERDCSLMMIHPERHFAYLTAISPSLEEVLLVPFHVEKKAVGTIWAVIHTLGKHFDLEDKRLLESLSDFAASAYATLVKHGSLSPLLEPQAR